MNTITVLPGQTLADIAIQCLGSLAKWQELSALNGLNMTDNINPGSVLYLPIIADKRVERFFTQGAYKPASGDVIVAVQGVGFMGIQFDFIVQ